MAEAKSEQTKPEGTKLEQKIENDLASIADECPDGVDVEKLIKMFGCKPFTDELVKKIETITGKKVPSLLAKGFISHRYFDELLDAYGKGTRFYLYTGRGPSSQNLHLGHLLPFLVTRELQKLFDVKLVIQITDDEKFLKRDLTLEQVRQYTEQNIKQIRALGFDPEKTFIFNDFNMTPAMYLNIIKIQSHITVAHSMSSFGVKPTDSVGKVAFPATQIMPCLPSSFPEFFGPHEQNLRCLVPCGIDQDPYFRIAKDILHQVGAPKPVLLHTTFVPSLSGVATKMSSSKPETAIFLDETQQTLKKKIQKSFSGGRDTAEEHKRLGGRPEIDVAFKFVELFGDPDEASRIGQEYKSGAMMTGQLKARAVEIVFKLLESCRRSEN